MTSGRAQDEKDIRDGSASSSAAPSAEAPQFFVIVVPVGGNAVMFAPNPMADPTAEWCLRYSLDLNNPLAGRYSSAAIVESFDYLLSEQINMTEATRRLRLLRAARRAHVKGEQA